MIEQINIVLNKAEFNILKGCEQSVSQERLYHIQFCREEDKQV